MSIDRSRLAPWLSAVAVGLVAVVVGSWAADRKAVAEEPAGGAFEVTGEVLDASGKPVADTQVFAVEAGTARIAGAGRSGPDGRFAMRLASRQYNIGIMSSRYFFQSLDRVDDARVRIRVVAAFPGREAA